MTRETRPELEALVEPPQFRWLGLAAGLLIVGALAVIDYDWSPQRIITATVVIGPFIAALVAPPAHTAVVGAAASTVAGVSAIWHDNFGTQEYWLRLGVVVLGSVVAVVASQARARAAESRRRFALLAAIAEVADGTGTLGETADHVGELIVPAFADVVLIDVMRHGELERIMVRAAGPDAGRVEAWLRERPPMPADVELGSRHAIDAGTQLIERVEAEHVEQFSTGDRDAELIASLGTRSTITVPLRARGRILGAISLSVSKLSGRRYGRDEAGFAEVLSGRVALALDNAGLFAELETIEAQLGAALGSLTDTVTIQDRTGRLVYANEAAARDLGFASARELMATPVAQIAQRYDVYGEDGRPMEIDELPGRRVLAGEENPAPLITRSVHRETGTERWTQVKATAVRDHSGRPRLAVNVVEDITEIKRAELAQRLLSRAGDALASSLDYERTLQQVTDLAVPELADWAAVSLPDRRGYLRQVAVAHSDPEQVRFAREVAARYVTHVDDPGGAAEVLRTGQPQVVNAIPPEMLRAAAQDDQHYELLSRLGMRAAMVVPLLVGGHTIGTLALVSSESGRTFSPADVELASELGRRAGTAVENARLYSERSEIAQTLSQGLLPSALPTLPGWATATLYRPAGEANLVGGDFYDAVNARDGWLVLVGDVAGRGAQAAALTALARHTMRALTAVLGDPLQALERLNHELHERGGPALCTIGCVLLRGDQATIVCAGHPPPLLVRDGGAEEVGKFGPMVGAFASAAWSPVTVTVRPGDLLVLYTDGVTDALGPNGDRFGEEPLRETLAAATGAEDAVARIRDALAAFQRGEQADDTAVVALERTG